MRWDRLKCLFSGHRESDPHGRDITKHLRSFRWDRMKCHFFGHRQPNAHNLGIDLEKPGWVDFFCSRCQALISTQPRIEVTDEETVSIIDDLFDGYGRDMS